ncbi:MAG: DCC1-like thiol-disulfide oxidoreductase family protein [Planctomycetota bacterium]
MGQDASGPVLLFDGVCNLCNSSVLFVLDRDVKKQIRFAPLQSKEGERLLKQFQLSNQDLDSMVLVRGDRFYKRSAAALRIAMMLRFPWPLLAIFLLVPPFFRDIGYNWVARNRYRWFGKTDQCRIPTPELRQRFLG